MPVQHGNVQPNTGHDGESSGRAGLGMRELWWAPPLSVSQGFGDADGEGAGGKPG